MRTILLLTTLFTLITIHAQVGIGTNAPSNASILELKSDTSGLLIPRIQLQNLNQLAPITGQGSEGLLVYNTNATIGKGFYYWNLNNWQRVNDQKKAYDRIIGFDSSSDYICDGVDDHVQFQLAINSLPATGGSIYVKSGKYNFSSDITLSGKQNISIIGNGYNTLIRNNDQTAIVISGSNGITITSLSMKIGNIVLLNSNYCIFDKIEIDSCLGAGILLDGQPNSGSKYNSISYCTIKNSAGVGISLNQARDTKISSNTIIGNELEGITLDNQSHSCIVVGNRIGSNKGGAGQISIDFSDLCSISNNFISGSPSINLPGITFQNNLNFSNFNLITSNVIVDNAAGGILLKNNNGKTSNSNTINGNILRSNGPFSIKNETSNLSNIFTSNVLFGNPIIDLGTSSVVANNS